MKIILSAIDKIQSKNICIFSSTKKTKKYFEKYETHRTFVYEDIRRWKRNKK